MPEEQKLDLGSKLAEVLQKFPEYAALVLKYMNPADEFLSQYIKAAIAPSENEQIIEYSSEHQMKFGGENLENYVIVN